MIRRLREKGIVRAASGYRRAARAPRSFTVLLPVAILTVIAAMHLTGCEESLPAYEQPDIPLAAEILIEPRLTTTDVSESAQDFTVMISHTGDYLNDWTLPVPWSVSVNISVFLERDPGRHVYLSTQRTYTNPIDDLRPDYYVVIGFNLPLRDSEGRAWNWGDPEAEALDIVLQGRIRIGQLDLRVNMPRVTTSLQFSSP
jgi:hypothetical protein